MIIVTEQNIKIIVAIILILLIFLLLGSIFKFTKWIIRSIWYVLTGKRSKANPLQSKDWLTRAQARQEIRFQNALPPILPEAKPQKKSFFQRRKEKQGKFATGWTFNEGTQLWEPPKKQHK